MSDDEGPAQPRFHWDRPLTIVLLMAGLWNVTRTVADLRELPQLLDQLMSQLGAGSYGPIATAQALGWVASACSVAALVLAIGFSVPRLRQRRTAFWIPLAAAAVSLVAITTLVMIALFADPAAGAAVWRRGA